MRRIFLFGMMLLAISACFESPQPLSDAKTNVRSSALIGVWRCTSEEMDKKEFMSATVLAFDEQQLLVDLRHSAEPEIERYRMYPSEIGKHVLWNLQELREDGGAGSWVFVRLQSPSTDRLRVQIVKDSALRGADSKAKLAEVRTRVADDTIFADPVTCTRQSSTK